MEGDEESRETMIRHLGAAVARVRNDLEQVEFWASSITAFMQPVPDYDTLETAYRFQRYLRIPSAERGDEDQTRIGIKT